jgi:hypothetical protein
MKAELYLCAASTKTFETLVANRRDSISLNVASFRQFMLRLRSIPLLAALLNFVFCLALSAANDQPRWLEIHSTHFVVVTDAGESKGREIALRFEQMRTVFATLLGKDRLHESIPLTILALQNDKSYYQLAPLQNGQPIDRPGFFLTGEDQDFIALNLSESDSWRAVARDFATMLLNYNYPPAQPWFDDGLADYFSSIHIDSKQVEIGGEPFHSFQNAKPGTDSYIHVLSSETWLPIPELFATKRDSAGARSAIVEAEFWLLMHYLLHEKKLPETGAYLGAVLNQHMPSEDAIKQAYGMSSAELQKAAVEYFHSQIEGSAPKGTERFPVPIAADDSAIIPKALPEPDARALYAGVQVRVPDRHDIGRKALQELATTQTEADKKSEAKRTVKRIGEDEEQLPTLAVGNAIAHRFLAWDNIQLNDFEQAFKEIGDTAALNRSDMWVRYYVCVAKYRMAQVKHTEITGLANMMLDLKAVLEWNPEMAEAYDLLGISRNAGGGATAAMQAARAAITLSPRNERYVYHLAEIYVTNKKWEAADALLQRLKLSSDPQVATLAQNLLTQSGAERKYGIPAKAVSPQAQLQAQKTPFDVLEQDAAKREAAEKSSPTGPDKRETKFLKGLLVAVDCSGAPVATLTVNSGSGVLKLRAVDYRSLVLMGTDSFSCDWRNRQVTVNYKPSEGNAGDLVSLELR